MEIDVFMIWTEKYWSCGRFKRLLRHLIPHTLTPLYANVCLPFLNKSIRKVVCEISNNPSIIVDCFVLPYKYGSAKFSLANVMPVNDAISVRTESFDLLAAQRALLLRWVEIGRRMVKKAANSFTGLSCLVKFKPKNLWQMLVPMTPTVTFSYLSSYYDSICTPYASSLYFLFAPCNKLQVESLGLFQTWKFDSFRVWNNRKERESVCQKKVLKLYRVDDYLHNLVFRRFLNLIELLDTKKIWQFCWILEFLGIPNSCRHH